MLGVYLLFAVMGLGLLAFSLGDDGDASGHDVGSGHDTSGGGGHGSAGHAHAGDLLLGFFRPRNLIFFSAAFGVTGALLTWAGRTGPILAGGLALTMGIGAMSLAHGLFRWLRRTESAVEVVGDAALEGSVARVLVPVGPDARGRVACLVAGREVHVTARLAPGAGHALEPGREVLVVRMVDGEAEVSPYSSEQITDNSSNSSNNA